MFIGCRQRIKQVLNDDFTINSVEGPVNVDLMLLVCVRDCGAAEIVYTSTFI